MYEEQIEKGAHGRTALRYLQSAYAHSTELEWRERLIDGQVEVNGTVASPDRVLQAGDWLRWARPPWEEPEVPLHFARIYIDEDLFIVSKPSGLPTVPAGGFLEHTLLARVRAECPEATPMHRLGRGTSGLVVFARTGLARSALQAAWRAHQVTKVYRALVQGCLESERTIETPIGPVPHPILGSLMAASPQGKASLTQVSPLELRGDTTLISASIATGRPHQIRIHLAAAGFPLVGDPLYAIGGLAREDVRAFPSDLGYQLHAHTIGFRHPTTQKEVHFESEPPPELRIS